MLVAFDLSAMKPYYSYNLKACRQILFKFFVVIFLFLGGLFYSFSPLNIFGPCMYFDYLFCISSNILKRMCCVERRLGMSLDHAFKLGRISVVHC